MSDQIIDEVRRIRDELAQECGHDVHELFNLFRRMQAGSNRQHVVLPSKTIARGGEQPPAARPEHR